MALTTQIVIVCAIVGINSAHVIYNHHRHRPQDDFGGMPQLLQEMFHPRNPMYDLFQIHPMDNPGILGFGSFADQGLGDFSSGMFGQGQGGYGTEDLKPMTSASLERENGNSQSPVDNFGEQEKDRSTATETTQDELGDQLNNNNKEREPNKYDDTDNSNKDQGTRKVNSVEKEGDIQTPVDSEIESASNSNKYQSGNDSVSKQRDKDSIIFPDKLAQAKDEIAKESSYYVAPQQSNGYVSSSSPQVIYTTSYIPSASSTSQAPYVSNTAQSNSQSQPTLSSVPSYPSTNNINVQNPQPQYQTSNNPSTNPGYTLVTLPSNGANSNSPVYYPNNAPVTNPPQNNNYQSVSPGQQYYMVSMNGQNVLVPVNNVQTVPNQPNGNSQTNFIPINQGSYVPSTSQVNYVPINNQNTSPSPPQNNGQVHYILVQLAPQNNPQNNNQVFYVPANQGIVQTPGQNTQGNVNYVPLTSQPTMQTPPQDNQVTYVSGNPPQVVQVQPQNQPQSNNQVHYIPANPQTVVQVGSNTPTNSGQTTYVPFNPQNPQTTTQYKLVPLNPQNSGQGNLVRLVPATLTSNGNVSLLSFKEKAKLSAKDEKKSTKNKSKTKK